tara:strand:+ start:131 stop:526 length:396 start_codon:yes stop_codon:yes gene_type:complete
MLRLTVLIAAGIIALAAPNAALASEDGVYKAKETTDRAIWTAEFVVKKGKLESGKLTIECLPNVCNSTVPTHMRCSVPAFASSNPLTKAFIECTSSTMSSRELEGNLFDGTMQTNGSDRNAGAATLKFVKQ